MGYIVAWLLGIISTSVVFLFGFCTNSVVRSKAEKSPDSLAHMMISFVDSILESTIFRPVFAADIQQSKPAERSEGSSHGNYIRRLHDFMGVDSHLHVKQSFGLSLDLSRRLPRVYTEYNFGLPLLIIIMLIMVVGTMALTGYIASDWESGKARLSVMTISFVGSLILAVAISRTFLSNDGLLSILEKIYYWNYVIISIDNRSASVQSGWGRFMFENSENRRFIILKSRFNRGIAVKSELSTATVFMYPVFLTPFVLTDGELEQLCANLNKLLALAKSLPDLKYDELTV